MQTHDHIEVWIHTARPDHLRKDGSLFRIYSSCSEESYLSHCALSVTDIDTNLYKGLWLLQLIAMHAPSFFSRKTSKLLALLFQNESSGLKHFLSKADIKYTWLLAQHNITTEHSFLLLPCRHPYIFSAKNSFCFKKHLLSWSRIFLTSLNNIQKPVLQCYIY